MPATPDFTFTVPRIEDLAAPSPLPRWRKKTVRGPIAAKPPDEAITVLVDTREQLPHDLSPLRMEFVTLKTGDYSVAGLERKIAIERKSLPDFLACVGVERDRFEDCVQRLLGYPHRAIVIEASWDELEAGAWRSKVTPAAAIGSIDSWIACGVPVVLAGTRKRAGERVASLLIHAARQEFMPGWQAARMHAAEQQGEKCSS